MKIINLTSPHVNLSYCFTSVKKGNNANIKTSVIFSFKLRLLTIIYYKPEFI